MNIKLVLGLIGAAATILAAAIQRSCTTTVNSDRPGSAVTVTQGPQSPVVTASGAVTITYGANAELSQALAEAMKRQGSNEEDIKTLLSQLGSDTASIRRELDRRITELRQLPSSVNSTQSRPSTLSEPAYPTQTAVRRQDSPSVQPTTPLDAIAMDRAASGLSSASSHTTYVRLAPSAPVEVQNQCPNEKSEPLLTSLKRSSFLRRDLMVEFQREVDLREGDCLIALFTSGPRLIDIVLVGRTDEANKSLAYKISRAMVEPGQATRIPIRFRLLNVYKIELSEHRDDGPGGKGFTRPEGFSVTSIEVIRRP
jgi:hypothetical protein